MDPTFLAALVAATAAGLLLLLRRPGRKHVGEMLKVLRDTRRVAAPPHSIFISYRRKDSAETVGRLYDHLVAAYGQDAVFKDVDSISLGQDFRKALEAGLTSCQIFLCVMGPGWAGAEQPGSARRAIDDPGDFVRIEVETALERGLLVMPLLVQHRPMPTPETLPSSLRELAFRQAQPLRPDPDFGRDVQRLCADIDVRLAKRSDNRVS